MNSFSSNLPSSRDGTNRFGGFVLGDKWQHEMVGAAKQEAPACDLQVNNGVRNTLFTNADKDGRTGDLAARNIQRGRDHGIPGYDKLRKACRMTDLPRTEAPKEISGESWRKLMKTYNNDPAQIDGFTAGLTEAKNTLALKGFPMLQRKASKEEVLAQYFVITLRPRSWTPNLLGKMCSEPSQGKINNWIAKGSNC